jgi:DNA replication protein DnaC
MPHRFFQLISRRYERVFGDPVVATAILDRLLHRSHVNTIRGDSYWLREKRRSGLVKTPALPERALA